MTDYTAAIKQYIDMEISVLQKLDHQQINRLMNALDDARKRNGTIYVMGNGGSGATASHMANDFNKGISEYIAQKFNFVCLNDNVATVLAVANDIGFEAIFEFQIRGKITENDVVIGLSGSGNSENVLKAVRLAKSVGATTVGLTGYDGGELGRLVDIPVHVPVVSMQITEDIHMVFDHVMMAVFYKELCGIDHLKGT